MRSALRSVAYGAVLTCTAGAAMGDALLAPFYDTTTGATFASVITKDFQSPAVGPYNTVWTYWFKNSLTDLDEACSRSSRSVTAAQASNDLTTFNVGSGNTVFPGDTGSMSAISPTVGMFAVANGRTGDEHSMAGEVLFVSNASTTGTLISSGRMVNDPSETSADNFDDMAYGAFGSNVTVAPVLLWHPMSLISTNWIVSVVDADMEDLATTNLWVELAVARQTAGTNGTGGNYQTGFYYDRDGNAVATSQTVTLRCIGLLTLPDLIDAGGLAGAQNNGGWAHLGIVDLDAGTVAADAVSSMDRGILVGKIETQTGGTISLYTSQNRQDF
jgi:hypothetical protein